MDEKNVTIPVTLDEKTFRRFAMFDAFVVRRKWLRPALFALIMCAFAAAALFLRKEQSGLIAAVLLTVGLGLPLVYVGVFLSQVNLQVLRNKLSPPRRVYTVTLSPEALLVHNDQREEEDLRVGWKEVHRAWKRKRCIYLYVTEKKAVLLPEGQGNVDFADLWQLLRQRLDVKSPA